MPREMACRACAACQIGQLTVCVCARNNRGNRAADEFLLDWADIVLVYDERWDGVVGALPAAVVQQGEPENPFSLDSKRIKSSLATYLQNENRYASLRRTNVERADYLQGEFEASTVKRMETNQRKGASVTPYSPHLTHHTLHTYR